jgi:hypothetical protein
MSHGAEQREERQVAPMSRVVEDVTLLAAFLLSSGRGLLDEPAEYGVARCADGARRALELLEDACGVREPRLVSLWQRLEEAMSGPMDEAGLAALLDGACEDVVSVLTDEGDDNEDER